LSWTFPRLTIRGLDPTEGERNRERGKKGKKGSKSKSLRTPKKKRKTKVATQKKTATLRLDSLEGFRQ